MLTTILMPTRMLEPAARGPQRGKRDWTTPTQGIRRDLWNLEKDQLLHTRPMDSRLMCPCHGIGPPLQKHLSAAMQPHSNPHPMSVRPSVRAHVHLREQCLPPPPPSPCDCSNSRQKCAVVVPDRPTDRPRRFIKAELWRRWKKGVMQESRMGETPISTFVALLPTHSLTLSIDRPGGARFHSSDATFLHPCRL